MNADAAVEKLTCHRTQQHAASGGRQQAGRDCCSPVAAAAAGNQHARCEQELLCAQQHDGGFGQPFYTQAHKHTHTHNTQQADTEQAHTAQHIHSTTRDTTEHNRAHTHSEHTCGLTDLKALAAEVDQIVSVLRHSAEPALLPQQRRQSLGAGRNHVSSQLQYGFSMGIAAVGRDSPWCRPRPHLRASPETEGGRTL